MTALAKIRDFFKRPEAKGAEKKAVERPETKVAKVPEEKAGKK